METKTRKTTMIGAALAVAIIALAGAGYAAVTQYTATTTNTDNYMDATFLTLTQDGNGAAYTDNFLANIYFDSLNTAQSTTKYTPVYTHKYEESGNTKTFTETDTGANRAVISNDLTLSLVPTNSKAQTVDMKVTVTNFTYKSGLTYTMVLGSYGTGATEDVFTAVENGVANYDNDASVKAWVFNDLVLEQSGSGATAVADTTTWSVLLFVSAGENGVSEANTGFPASGADNKATFTFKVTAEVTNTTNTTPSNP